MVSSEDTQAILAAALKLMNATQKVEFLSKTPSLTPPEGVRPDFVTRPDNQITMFVFTTIFLFLTTIAVLARIYTKAFIVRCIHGEDYLLLLSYAFYVAFLGLVYEQSVTNGGRHQWDIPLIDMAHAIWLEWLSTIMYGFMIAFAKWALLLLMQRIFCLEKKDKTRWLIQTLILSNILFWTASVVAQMFLCIPQEKIWMQFLVDGTCSDPNTIFIMSAAWNLLMDIIILIIPMVMIPRLQVSKGLKWRLIGIFLLGSCACIASGLRIWFAIRLSQTDDRTAEILHSIWSACLEHTGVIIVICAPSFPKLWKHWRGLNSTVLPSSGGRSMTLSNRRDEQHKWVELQKGTSAGLKDEFTMVSTHARTESQLKNPHINFSHTRSTGGSGGSWPLPLDDTKTLSSSPPPVKQQYLTSLSITEQENHHDQREYNTRDTSSRLSSIGHAVSRPLSSLSPAGNQQHQSYESMSSGLGPITPRWRVPGMVSQGHGPEQGTHGEQHGLEQARELVMGRDFAVQDQSQSQNQSQGQSQSQRKAIERWASQRSTQQDEDGDQDGDQGEDLEDSDTLDDRDTHLETATAEEARLGKGRRSRRSKSATWYTDTSGV